MQALTKLIGYCHWQLVGLL